MLGGYDTTTAIPHLYWIDYLGTKAIVNYGAHGAGMYVALSLMDKWWYEGMDKKAGMNLLHKCIDEVQNRESRSKFWAGIPLPPPKGLVGLYSEGGVKNGMGMNAGNGSEEIMRTAQRSNVEL